MNLLYYLTLTGILLSGLTRAQSNQPATTSPSTTTVSPATQSRQQTNRQQELYDQYHGIVRKANAPLSTTTTTAGPRQKIRTAKPSRPAMTKPAPEVARQPQKPASATTNSSFRIGARAGFTYPVDFDTEPNGDPAGGAAGGLVLQVGRGVVSFQPEINYSRTARKFTNFGQQTVTNATDQVVVPLLLKLASGSADGTRFFVNIGPYGSYVTSRSVNGVKQPLADNDGRFAYGAAAGIGIMIKAGPGHLTIEGRGYYQLGDSSNKSDFGSSKSITTETALGYVFPLGGR